MIKQRTVNQSALKTILERAVYDLADKMPERMPEQAKAEETAKPQCFPLELTNEWDACNSTLVEAITTESIPLTSDNPSSPKKPKHWLWTKERAAEMSRLGRIAKEQKRADAENPPLTPNGKNGEQRDEILNPHVSKTLMRVRKQVSRLFELIEGEIDPQKLDRLASALSRLAELERQLSGRPLPGSLRPRQEKPRRTTDVEPEA